jgi:hypothetical protein
LPSAFRWRRNSTLGHPGFGPSRPVDAGVALSAEDH